MEGIVCGIASINFRQNIEFPDENRIPNCMEQPHTAPQESINMALLCPEEVETSVSKFNPNETVGSYSSNEDDWQSEEEVVDAGQNKRSGRGGKGGGTFAERRQMPSRASKESSLTCIKRRTIMKPAKHISSLNKDFNNLKPADIKKIYLNKKLTKFRPSNLETIFEEPTNSQRTDDNDSVEEYEQVRFIGARKLRRALSCTDGFVLNKALVKRRRAKVKKTFGRRLSLKKISLEDFLEKLNSSMEDAKTPDPIVTEEMDESTCIPIQTPVSTLESTTISSISTATVISADICMNIAPTTSLQSTQVSHEAISN